MARLDRYDLFPIINNYPFPRDVPEIVTTRYETVTLTEEQAKRFYSFLAGYYQNGNFFDLILIFNKISDPNNLTAGTEIRLPDIGVLNEIYGLR